MNLYTKEGKPLQVGGQIVFSRTGQVVGRINGRRVFGKNGRYVGTIAGDRLVYRSTDSVAAGTPFCAANRTGIAKLHRVASVVWGREPDIPA
ncbi:hypothetical protein WJ85_18305 [Burkholderia ubonensis]|uniref:hypothetical protein n=1 Tax=Burkholderia ubonensis TaxID=101571 RepID=UPI0007548727|nr:hypothetical protein [Burkholderia ubonensis]KVO27860.1 hypothetical protein WJ76_27535 [Burkholderia ubonensis]KVP11469.1 hypothetical protein WJ85_18305 [Burkholderia ubonensis]